jgi:hypothetical protein
MRVTFTLHPWLFFHVGSLLILFLFGFDSAEKVSFMLRHAQRERKYINDFHTPSVRPEFIEGWTEAFPAESGFDG